jgi:hypothetical protein
VIQPKHFSVSGVRSVTGVLERFNTLHELEFKSPENGSIQTADGLIAEINCCITCLESAERGW